MKALLLIGVIVMFGCGSPMDTSPDPSMDGGDPGKDDGHGSGCSSSCTAGASMCMNGNVSTCVTQASGCRGWSTPVSCGAGNVCGTDGACACAIGQYACASGCCAYEVDDGALGCNYDLDVAATSASRWGYVTFVRGADSTPSFTYATVRRVVHTSSTLTVSDLATYVIGPSWINNLHVAIDLDGNDTPHVAYFEFGQITYVGPDGVKRTVAGSDGNNTGPTGCTTVSPVGDVDLVVDRANGTVHLAYPAIAPVGSSTATASFIIHSQRTTTGWTCDVVAQGNGSAFWGPIAIARDAGGDLVVAYTHTSSSGTRVEVSRGAGSSWAAMPVSSAISGNEHLARSIALGFSPTGKPLVAYEQGTNTPWKDTVRAAILGEVTPVEVFGVTPSATGSPQVDAVGAASDDESPHGFANVAGAASGFFDVKRAASAWHADQIAPFASVASATGDDSGGLHGAYCAPFQGTNRVYHVYR